MGRPPARSGRAGRRLGLGAGALVLLVAGGVGGYLLGHSSSTDVLDSNSVANGVRTVVQNNYGVANVTDVTCPAGMKVTVHARYTCTFTAGSAHATVDIVIENTAGQYVVQGPKA